MTDTRPSVRLTRGAGCLRRTSALSVAASLVVAWVVASAQSPAPGAQARTPTMIGYPAVGAPPVIRLVAKGAAPRKQLRYVVPADQKAGLEVTTSGRMAASMGGVRTPKGIPTMTATIELAVTGVAASGDISYDLAFTDLTVKASADMTTQDLQNLQRYVSGILPMKGSATVSNRGVIKTTRLDVADPRFKEVIFQMTSSVDSLWVPLPEQAVGVGARWEVRQAIAAGAKAAIWHPTIFQKTEYEVASIDGPAVSVRVTVDQSAPAQLVRSDLLGVGMDMKSMFGAATGTFVVQMHSVVSRAEVLSTTSMSGAFPPDLNGPATPITLSARDRITVAPAGMALAPDATLELKALRGITVVNLSGSSYSMVGPGRVCYPRAIDDKRGDFAGVSIAMGGLLKAAAEVLTFGGMFTSGRSTDFLEIDAEIHDGEPCSATISLELRRGLGKARQTTLTDGRVVTGYDRSPVIWRRTFDITGAPAGFSDRVIDRFKLDVGDLVRDVARANPSKSKEP